MTTTVFSSAMLEPAPLNRILSVLAVVMALVSYLSRRKNIGGWLLYFYYWISAFLLAFLWEVVQNPAAYFRRSSKPDLQLALIMATLPRLIAVLSLAAAAFLLLLKREWLWVERVRSCLLIAALCAGISVVIDHYYFPQAVLSNAARLGGLLLWTGYFFVSERVEAVFLGNASRANC
jgi:hypothetical protein